MVIYCSSNRKCIQVAHPVPATVGFQVWRPGGARGRQHSKTGAVRSLNPTGKPAVLTLANAGTTPSLCPGCAAPTEEFSSVPVSLLVHLLAEPRSPALAAQEVQQVNFWLCFWPCICTRTPQRLQCALQKEGVQVAKKHTVQQKLMSIESPLGVRHHRACMEGNGVAGPPLAPWCNLLWTMHH